MIEFYDDCAWGNELAIEAEYAINAMGSVMGLTPGTCPPRSFEGGVLSYLTFKGNKGGVAFTVALQALTKKADEPQYRYAVCLSGDGKPAEYSDWDSCILGPLAMAIQEINDLAGESPVVSSPASYPVAGEDVTAGMITAGVNAWEKAKLKGETNLPELLEQVFVAMAGHAPAPSKPAVSAGVLAKLRSAQRCHPNAVQHLIAEAIQLVQDGEPETPVPTDTAAPVGLKTLVWMTTGGGLATTMHHTLGAAQAAQEHSESVRKANDDDHVPVARIVALCSTEQAGRALRQLKELLAEHVRSFENDTTWDEADWHERVIPHISDLLENEEE